MSVKLIQGGKEIIHYSIGATYTIGTSQGPAELTVERKQAEFRHPCLPLKRLNRNHPIIALDSTTTLTFSR